MNANDKVRIPIPVIPTPLKLHPAARRQHLLELMRARVPARSCSSKKVITASHSSRVPAPVAPEMRKCGPR